jgi:hypothetical protein
MPGLLKNITNYLRDQVRALQVNHVPAPFRLNQLSGGGECGKLDLLIVTNLVRLLRALQDSSTKTSAVTCSGKRRW